MNEEKQFKIDIPQSLEGYKVTLFWGLGIKQIVLVFIATLFVGFAVFSLASRHFFTAFTMLIISGLSLLGILEIRGRNFYRYLLFIFSYYQAKPKVLIYHHYPASGIPENRNKQLVYQKQSNTKTLIVIYITIAVGLLLLILTGIHLYHVIHK